MFIGVQLTVGTVIVGTVRFSCSEDLACYCSCVVKRHCWMEFCIFWYIFCCDVPFFGTYFVVMCQSSPWSTDSRSLQAVSEETLSLRHRRHLASKG